MNFELYKEIRKKEEKTEAEVELLKCYRVFAYISEMLVEESKLHISSEEALRKMRDYMNKNL